MKHPWSFLCLAVSVTALAACSSGGGTGVVPGVPGREPELRAIPIHTPSPTPTPTPVRDPRLRAIPIHTPSPTPTPNETGAH
jgi:hypothetical protein